MSILDRIRQRNEEGESNSGVNNSQLKIVNFRKKFAVFVNTTLFVLARLRSSYTVRHCNQCLSAYV